VRPNAKPPRIDTIVCEDLSRVTRDVADSANLFKRLQYIGVPLVGVADGINTSSPHAKMSYGMKALMGEAYIDDLRFRTKRGLDGRALADFSTGGGGSRRLCATLSTTARASASSPSTDGNG
jgi:DNA invertase Pin-like site-specific DNA recombinase